MHLLTAGNLDFHAHDDLAGLAVKHHLDVWAQQQHGLSTQGFEVGSLGQHLAQLLYAGIEEVYVRWLQLYANYPLAGVATGLGDGYAVLELLLLFVHGLALSSPFPKGLNSKLLSLYLLTIPFILPVIFLSFVIIIYFFRQIYFFTFYVLRFYVLIHKNNEEKILFIYIIIIIYKNKLRSVSSILRQNVKRKT